MEAELVKIGKGMMKYESEEERVEEAVREAGKGILEAIKEKKKERLVMRVSLEGLRLNGVLEKMKGDVKYCMLKTQDEIASILCRMMERVVRGHEEKDAQGSGRGGVPGRRL